VSYTAWLFGTTKHCQCGYGNVELFSAKSFGRITITVKKSTL